MTDDAPGTAATDTAARPDQNADAGGSDGGGGGGGGEQRTTPSISVILCTYNRGERVGPLVTAVLAQVPRAAQLVVVDDGSTDATAQVLDAVADPRLRLIRQANAGPCAARNAGLAAATGEWTVFLDDDDMPQPGWLAALAGPMHDQAVGITCCGAVGVDTRGMEIRPVDPSPLGEPFGDTVGIYRAGTFAARTELLRRTGGYLDGLGTSHQFELFIRLLTVTQSQGLQVVSSAERPLHLEWRPGVDRWRSNPRRLFDATRWLLARHPQVFAGQPQVTANYEGIVGTAAARLGDWSAARRHLWRAVRLAPRDHRRWARLGLAVVSPLGRRIWGRFGDTWATGHATLGVPRQEAPAPSGDRELFLAWGYQENPGMTSDATEAPSGGGATAGGSRHRARIHRRAVRLSRRQRSGPVLDLCCDPRSAEGDLDDATWEQLGVRRPGLILCVDTITRVADPVGLLRRLAQLARDAPVLLSTPDRARSDPDRPLGPPRDERHRREWTFDQFELLLLSTGFVVERAWHLAPRRSQMAFLVRARP
ncbi:MAG: glycosyltransferase family 2 protein [Acidimicrobiales bacterium]